MAETRGPIQCLQDAIDTFIQRGRIYDGAAGQAYKMFGPIMMAFFPNGITITNADDWNRYSLFHMEVAKLARYASNFQDGHIDSQHDLIVYASMLESLDLELQEKKREAKAELNGECVTCGMPLVFAGAPHVCPGHEAWVR